jgi:CobQ-like glutamine amidotransferase family enzyme
VGLLDVTTVEAAGHCVVDEVVAESSDGELPTLTGFENSGG